MSIARKWWSENQDNFVAEVRGAGFDTHSLYDVPAALEAFERHIDGEWIAVTQRVKELEAALEKVVWRKRAQFPDDPYCEICGAGSAWAAKHGRQPSCPLSDDKRLPSPPRKVGEK